MGINANDTKQILLAIANVIETNKQYLTDLDAAIGDGDHGINMAKGFKVVAEKLAQTNTDKVSDLFKVTATTLISNVGGASGPLYGTFFMKAAAAAKDKTELDTSDFCAILKEGIEGVKMRGKSQQGEKTMLDALIPAFDSLTDSLQKGESGKNAVDLAAKAAREGAEHTKEIVATKGRASYLGERSIGHIDPGAMSSCLMLEVVSNTLSAT